MRCDNPTLPEPHVALGCVQFYNYWNWSEAEREFQHALELNPSSWWTPGYLGWLRVSQRRLEEGPRAVEVSGGHVIVEIQVALLLAMAGDTGRAEAMVREI